MASAQGNPAAGGQRAAAASARLRGTRRAFKCRQRRGSKPPASPAVPTKSGTQRHSNWLRRERAAPTSGDKPGLQLAENWHHRSQPASYTTLPVPLHICSSQCQPLAYCNSLRSCSIEKPKVGGPAVAQEIFLLYLAINHRLCIDPSVKDLRTSLDSSWLQLILASLVTTEIV